MTETADFWDTNLLLGYTVDWDRLGPPVDTYLQARGSHRETIASTRVFEEARRVVEKQRRRARTAADRVFEQFDAGRHDTVDDVKDFVCAEFADDWGKVDPVLDYIDHHGSAFLGLTQTNSERALRSTFEEITDDFAEPDDSVQRLRRGGGALALEQFTGGLDSYRSEYAARYDELDTLLDDTDRDLLLDSHHAVAVTGRSSLGFATFDRGDIADNHKPIEACLDGVSVVDCWQFS